MAEPRPDMLPDASQTIPDGPPAEVRKEAEPAIVPSTVPAPAPADPVVPTVEVKTPPNELLAALHEERELRKQAEQKLKDYESGHSSPSADTEPVSEEGKVLKSQIDSMAVELSAIKRERENDALFANYPQLKDKKEDFIKFREGYTDTPPETVAKIFLAEHDLLEPKRKGLERPTSGPKTAPTAKYTPEEIDRIRTTQPRRFIELIRSGAIDPDKI